MLPTGACVEGRVNPMYGTAFDQEPLQKGAFSVRPAIWNLFQSTLRCFTFGI